MDKKAKISTDPSEKAGVPIYSTKRVSREHFLIPTRPPVSSYFTHFYKGRMYHVFNAARMTYGTMCRKIAFVVQGKDTPLYKRNTHTDFSRIVVVNAENIRMTGKRLKKKIYRHHTGYTGNLKELSMENMMQKDPAKLIKRTVRGMLPKNKMRDDYLDKIIVFRGKSHNLFKEGLPQFGAVERVDYNELMGFSFADKTKTNLVVGSQEELDQCVLLSSA